jgi:sister chromatid cohesion protein DCC1
VWLFDFGLFHLAHSSNTIVLRQSSALNPMSNTQSPAKKARTSADDSLQIFQRVGETQTITFSTDFADRDVRLFEIPASVADDYEAGISFKLIGPKDASTDVVFCSENKTFTVKKVETSNSIFIVQPSASTNYTVSAHCKHYYEIKPTAPRVDRIVSLLKASEYRGHDREEEVNWQKVTLYTKDQFLSEIQASCAELNSQLELLGVVEIQGKMRLLAQDYLLGKVDGYLTRID